MKIGLQLFSIYKILEQDFEGTMRKVAAAGYQGVEFAGYYDYSAKDMKAFLQEIGLEPASAHIGYDDLKKDMDQQIAYAKELGIPKIVAPCFWYQSKQEWVDLIPNLIELGKACKKEGIEFGIHNHNQEFQQYDGQYVMDMIMQAIDSDIMFWEPDTYWLRRGGVDEIEYITKYADRCKLIHAKDIKDANEESPDSPAVGDGEIDFAKVAKAATNADWMIVEIERPGIENLIEDMEKSVKHLQSVL